MGTKRKTREKKKKMRYEKKQRKIRKKEFRRELTFKSFDWFKTSKQEVHLLLDYEIEDIIAQQQKSEENRREILFRKFRQF